MESPGPTAALTYSRRLSMESVDRVCLTPEGCVSAEPLLPVVTFLTTGLLALLLAATLFHLHSALEVIEEERARTRDERDAFDEFARRIESLEPTKPTAAVAPGGVTPLTNAADAGSLERVHDAYRDTVMAVPHYDEEYDEALGTNMAAEFGEELAAAVTGGAELTPQVKGALVRQSEHARTQREEFLRQLDREMDDLEDANTALSDVEATVTSLNDVPLRERSFDDLSETWRRLADLESRIDALLADRQEAIHERIKHAPGAPTMQEYLYDPLPVTYPVLSAGTTLADHVRTARRRVASALARRP